MKTLILLFCNLFIMQSCNKEAKTQTMIQDQFNYAVTATAPKAYPCEVHIGYIADDKKNMITGIPKTGMLQAGWNGNGAAGGMGGNVIPSYINLTYAAYAEKKFYHLEAELPREKMLEAFRKGFLIQGDEKNADGKYKLVHSTYNTFTVALAPGGMVVIFLGGSDRIEICRLQAKETFVDRNEFYDNPHQRTQEGFFDQMFKIAVPDSIQKQIQEKGIPFGLYDKYRKKYLYRFTFMPYDERDFIKMQTNRYYNGEITDFLQTEEIAKKEYKDQSIPYNIEFIFTKYNTEIVFDDQEMLSVFDFLQKKYPSKPIDIIVKPTFEYTDFKLSVKCENEEIPLTKYKVKGVWGG
ncbi:DUF2931 family protein [Chryseobacterium aquaticum]|uniref:DUF2931 family protein n=2 Tax=Chryseobacterium group TaxID=2782232 RepID=A0A848N9X8_9FLAO|nr:DUF2931 family protein [Chryseobacterium aquaticum]NRQ46288.1 DUF2931 family protein [Chryseobacterium sp. C-204]